MINVRAYGARGNAWYTNGINYYSDAAMTKLANDDTAAIQKCIDSAASRPGGDEVYLPRGRYLVTGLNMNSAVDVWTGHVRIRGEGWQQTRIIGNTTGIVLDCLGVNNLELRDLAITSGTMHPTVGVLWARKDGSPSANNNRMQNVQILGWFSQAAFASFGAELFQVENCRFQNGFPYGVGVVLGSDGRFTRYRRHENTDVYETLTVASPHGTIPRYGAQCNNFRGCLFDGQNHAGKGGLSLVLTDSHQVNFDGCFFWTDGQYTPCCVLISSMPQPSGSYFMAGPVAFRGCNFEAGNATHGVGLYQDTGIRSYMSVNFESCLSILFGPNPAQQRTLAAVGPKPSGSLVCWCDSYYKAGFRFDAGYYDRISVPYAERCDISAANGRHELTTIVNSRVFLPSGVLTSGHVAASQITVNNGTCTLVQAQNSHFFAPGGTVTATGVVTNCTFDALGGTVNIPSGGNQNSRVIVAA